MSITTGSAGGPRVERTVTMLAEKLEHLRAAGIYCLPNIKALAAEAGVSRVTMYRALRRLVDERLIASVPRKGLIINPSPDQQVTGGQLAPSTVPRSAGPRWRRLARTLITAVSDGTFPAGQDLPPAKHLAMRYGVSHATLRKALHAMMESGRIEIHGRGYRVVRLTAQTPSARIVFLGSAADVARLSTQTPRSPTMWRALERQAVLRETRIQTELLPTIDVHRSIDTQIEAFAKTLGPLWQLMGFMLSSIAPSDYPFAHLFSGLSRLRKPVAILDESSTVLNNPASWRHPGFALFPVGVTSRSGRQVGRRLTELGHRTITYFAECAGTPAHDVRLAGLREAIDEAGGHVTAMAPATSLASSVNMGHSPSFSAYRRVLLRETETFCRANGMDVSDSAPSHFAWTHAHYVLRGRELRPLFEEALRHHRSTAWVAYNDRDALLALDYLSQQGVKVPHTLSVVGFDDTIEAIGRGLTSYDFGMETAVHRMFEHVLSSPGSTRRLPQACMHEVPGKIMARGTTAPPGRCHALGVSTPM